MHRLLLSMLLTLALSLTLKGQGNCEISDLTIEATDCIDGLFYAVIEFDIMNPEGDVFGVVGNATDYGFFSYDSLPVEIGPLEGNGVTEWEFIVYDLGNPNCQATFELGIVDCCSFNNISLNQIVCTGLDEFRATLNFVPENTGDQGFFVYDENEVILGFFPYTALPVTVMGIPSFGIGQTFITICDSQNPNCCTDYYFADPDCNPNDCEIYNLTLEATDCETGQFEVVLDFDFENTGDLFTVVGNGNNYGSFQYGELPITLGSFDGNGETIYEFLVSDNMGGGCSEAGVIGPILCPPSCGFIEMEAEPVECTSDSTYHLWLNFTPIVVGDDGFTVYSQGVPVAMAQYNQLPVTIENFPASGDFFDVAVICDNANPDCCDTIEFQALLCAECLLYDLQVDASPCNDDDQFFVTLDFEYWNVSDSFQVGGNGNMYGHFSYDSLPIMLGPFEGDSLFFHEFVVLDLGGGFCLAGIELGVVDCDCGFDSISIETLGCAGNGSYDLVLDFVPVEVLNDFFDLYAGDDFIGFFAYEDLPILIENFPSNGGNDVITICDNDNPTCCASYEFPAPDCSCDVFELDAVALECNPEDSTFGVVVNFLYSGDSVQTFTVYYGDEEIGIVNGVNLPDTIYGLTSPGGTEVLTVCANEIEECCATREFVVPEPCGEEPCSISELDVVVSECDPAEQTFSLTIDFEWTGTGVAFFDVFLDGEEIALISGADLPVLLDGLTSDGGGASIRVCANDMPDCCAMVERQLPQCPEPCDIIELAVEVLPCEPETETFGIVVDFGWTGGAETFNVYLGNELVGAVEGVNVPDTIFGLTSPGGGELVRVCAAGLPECCDQREIQVGDPCGEVPCAIYDLTVETSECDPETNTFDVTINFQWDGESQFFDVLMSGQSIGFIHGDSLPVTIDGLVSDGGGEVITVCANDKPDCCASSEFSLGEPCGIEPCDIQELEVVVLECNSGSGTFAIVVNMEWTGDNDDFDVFLDGEQIGFIENGNVPYTIDGLMSEGGGALVTVCANDNKDCCAELEIELPECNDNCSVFELSVDPGPCTGDSTFTVSVTFGYEGFVNDSVDIWAGDIYLGSFPANQQPIIIDSVPWNGNAFMALRVCENGNKDCCMVREFEVPACLESCDIQNIITEVVYPCNLENGTVSMFLNIQWSGEIPGFDVYVGGEFFIFIDDAELPVTLEDFPLPDGDVAIIEVCAVDNPECCGTKEILIDCASNCDIYEVVVDTSYCSGDFALTAEIDYLTENLPGDLEVWVNNIYMGVYPGNISPMVVQGIPASEGIMSVLICSQEFPDCCEDVSFEGMLCGECVVTNMTAMATECDSSEFYVILDFDFGNIGEGFTVAGNGNQYGNFDYSEVPLTLGPFDGDSVTVWEFVVQDLNNPGCLDFVDLGTVDCDPVGVFDISGVQALEILYAGEGPYFIVPEGALQFQLWSYDGKLLTSDLNVNAGDIIRLTDYSRTGGLFIPVIHTIEKMYVDKAVVIN